jgi:hypothetical protein
MVQLDDLAAMAEELRQRGLDACHEILYGPHGGLEVLDIGDDFFPLWELLLPDNQEHLERLDFAAIKARRGSDWSVDPPRYGAVSGA